MPVGTTGSNASWGAGLAMFFTDLAPTVLGAATKFGGVGALLSGAFQAIGSGRRNIEAMKSGRMTGLEAFVDTAKDTGIATAAGATSAALGGAIIAALGPGLLPAIAGIAIATGGGYMIDRALHGLFK